MTTAALPTLYDLLEAHKATRRKISVGALRAAVKSGALKCVRLSESCSAKILIEADDLAAWLRSLRGKAQVVESPAQAHRRIEQAKSAEAEHAGR